MEITMNGEEGEMGDSMSRIFIGGLGASVTGDDLERIFSSFGRINGLDIIRTNNRSFAYVNLQPADEKSLAKLFSLYNGCAWKGGRLRLEKAKEHYLARLHREWATDATEMVTDSVDANKSVTPQDQASVALEKNGLKIFFPNQRKDSEDEKSLSRGMTEKMASENAQKLLSTKVKSHVAKLTQKDSKQDIHSQVNNRKSFPIEDNDGQPEVLELKESKRLKVEDGVCSSFQHSEARDNLSIGFGLEINGDASSKGHHNGTATKVQDGSHSRVQKASWKDLVGETGRVSFSLSSIIGGAGSPHLVKDRESKTLGALENSSNHSRKEISRELLDRRGKLVMEKGHKISSDNSHFLSELGVKPKNSESHKSELIAEMKNENGTMKGEEVTKGHFTEVKDEGKICNDQVDKDLNLFRKDTGSPALCMFMRSENAEAEWLKSKAAVQRFTKFRKKKHQNV